MALSAGYPAKPFPIVRELQKDNGEQFLSKYFHDNNGRAKEILEHPLNNSCQCKICSRNPLYIQMQVPHEEETAGDAQAAVVAADKENVAMVEGDVVTPPMEPQPQVGQMLQQ